MATSIASLTPRLIRGSASIREYETQQRPKIPEIPKVVIQHKRKGVPWGKPHKLDMQAACRQNEIRDYLLSEAVKDKDKAFSINAISAALPEIKRTTLNVDLVSLRDCGAIQCYPPAGEKAPHGKGHRVYWVSA